MADGKKNFTYHQPQPLPNQYQKTCRGIIHINRRMTSQGVQLPGSTSNKPHLKILTTQTLQGEPHSQALCNQAVQVPQPPLLRLPLYQLYLKSRIPLKNNPIPHGRRPLANHTAILGPVLLAWIRQNTPLSSVLLRAPNMRHRPATDTRRLKQPKVTLHTHRSV